MHWVVSVLISLDQELSENIWFVWPKDVTEAGRDNDKGKWSNLVIHSTSFLIFPIAHHSEMSLEWRNEAEMKECNRKIMNDRNERNGH